VTIGFGLQVTKYTEVLIEVRSKILYMWTFSLMCVSLHMY